MNGDIVLEIFWFLFYSGMGLNLTGIYIENRFEKNFIFDLIGFGLPSIIILFSLIVLFLETEQILMNEFYLVMGIIAILSGMYSNLLNNSEDDTEYTG